MINTQSNWLTNSASVWKESHKPKFSEMEEIKFLLDSKLNCTSVENADRPLLVIRTPVVWRNCQKNTSEMDFSIWCLKAEGFILPTAECVQSIVNYIIISFHQINCIVKFEPNLKSNITVKCLHSSTRDSMHEIQLMAFEGSTFRF